MWKHILLKNLPGTAFRNCHTISETDRGHKFQVFEVLITETLAIIDPATRWSSVPVAGDSGVDFIGEREELKTPYLLDRPTEIVLGQIKRRSMGYDKAAFRYDIIRMIEYYNENYAPQKTLFQIIHVLSTDRNTDPKQWLENASYPYVQYHVSPINALDFFRFWRIEQRFFLHLLEGVCSQEEQHVILDYLNSIDEDWTGLIHVQAHTKPSAYLGEEFTCEVQLECQVDLTLGIYIAWEPAYSEYASPIVLIFPHNMLRGDNPGIYVPIYQKTRLLLKMKAMMAGEFDLGILHFYSKSGEKITDLPLGYISIYPGIVSSFYEAPFAQLLTKLRSEILTQEPTPKLWTVTGQGGIGKSTLAKELRITAMNQGYYTVSVPCGNDIINTRQPVLDVILQLIPRAQDKLYVYEELFELVRGYMGINFDAKWAEPLMRYILGEKETPQTPIIECFITLLLLACAKTPVFIWISDMHWASKESISFFQALTAAIKRDEPYFVHSLIIIFEGRDSETLLAEHKAIYPYEWMQFIQQRDLRHLSLHAWLPEHSKEFISMMINPHNRHDATNGRLTQLEDLAFRYAGGNPLHIKEYLRYLIDQQAIHIHADGTLELINYQAAIMTGNQSIRDIILARILFFKKKYSDIIDCYIVLSHIVTNRPVLYRFMKTHVFIRYADYEVMEGELSIVSCEDREVVFLHEHYEELLKRQKITNPDLLKKLCRFFDEDILDCEDELECLDAITIHTLAPMPDNGLLAARVLSLLGRPASDTVAFRCYEILLNLPKKFWQKQISLSEIYFNLSEIAIRISSWKNARQYLERILCLTPRTEQDWLYRILSCKSLANICGVSLELERSISLCEQGLETVKQICRREFENPRLQDEFLRQHEMLLNRIAVTYWFAGLCTRSAPYQSEALSSARARSDIYSIAHTLYETGVRKLHTDIPGGIKDIQEALNLLPPRSKYTEPQERALVEVELLIARLMSYSEARDKNELKDILAESEALCQMLAVETANYEYVLCQLVQGICHVESEDLEAALRCFYTSADLAQIGALSTVLWKSYLNLAQTYACLAEGSDSYREQVIRYAKLSKRLLLDGIERNISLSSYRALMHLPLQQIGHLLNESVCFAQEPGAQEPLSVVSKGYRFFIMD